MRARTPGLAGIVGGAAAVLGLHGAACARDRDKPVERWEDDRVSRSVPREDERAVASERAAASLRPDPGAPLELKILTDARCVVCDADDLKRQASRSFPGATISTVDYAGPGGAALWSALKPSLLPAVVLPSFTGGARKVGASYVLSGGDWNPECADAGGCALAECASQFLCRPETPATLDLYLTSHDPLAARALGALPEVMRNFEKHGAAVTMSVHYIGEQQVNGRLTSRYGQEEVDDDLRNVCVAKLRPPALLDFLLCRAADLRSPWKSCAGAATGVDVTAIEACATGADGQGWLLTSFKEAEDARIDLSPMWVVNGRYKVGAVVEAEWIKRAVCEHNALGGCGVTLSGAGRQPRWVVAKPLPPRGSPPP